MRRFQAMVLLAAVLILAALPSASSAGGARLVLPADPAPAQPGASCSPTAQCPSPPPSGVALIHVSKTAVPTSLPAGGGPVTYTYTVTNGGTVPLTGVTVSDNTCAPVTFVGGDTNGNNILDLTETWTYTCTTTVKSTTTNTATAQGVDTTGQGTMATATATVTVGCPPGTTGPNCPPPPCPPGTTGPNCPPPPPITSTLVFECFDLRSALDPQRVVVLTTKNFGNDTVLVRRATRMCEPALKTKVRPPAGTAQPSVFPNAQISLDMVDPGGGRHNVMLDGTMGEMPLAGGGVFDTEMLQLALESTSPMRMPSPMGSFFDSFFDVFVDLDMAHPSAGRANSFFDVFTEISLSPNSMLGVREAALRLMPGSALRFLSDPAGGYALPLGSSIPLLDPNGQPSGWTIGGGTLTPDPASPNQPVTRVLECFNVQSGKDVHAAYGLRTANFGADSVVVRNPDRLCEGALKAREPIPAGTTGLQPPPVVWECYRIVSRNSLRPGRFWLNTRNFGVDPISVLKADSLCEEASKTIVSAAGTTGNSIGQPTGRVFECFSIEAKTRQQPFFLWTRNFGPDKPVVARASLMCEPAQKRPLGTFTP